VDKQEFEGRASRLQEVGKIIEKLPTEIRGEAFQCLKGYVSRASVSAAVNDGDRPEIDNANDGSLFSRFDHDKPSDNVRLIAANIFEEYGSEPFSIEEAKTVAAAIGITVPDRIDMTLRNATENGKKLFVKAGQRKFKPTVHGEAYLKATYGVRKGTTKRGAESE
jgi:hypothetical protein